MHQRLFVVGGTGKVGDELLRLVVEKDTAGHKNPSAIVGIANSTHVQFDEREIPAEGLAKILAVQGDSREKMREYLSEGMAYQGHEALLKMVKDAGLDGEVIFVDATALGEEMRIFHRMVLENSQNRVVTANKNPVSLYSMEDFRALAGNRRYNFDVTVMAGRGPIAFAKERVDVRQNVLSIEGMLSGTLGFIFSELEKGKQSFSEIVRSAKENDITEPKPTDDLSGLDVARKLVILARCAGYDVNFENMEIEPLVDKRYGEMSVEESLEALKDEDGRFRELNNEATAAGKVLRYIGTMRIENGALKLSTGLQQVDKKSPFATLRGTKNCVVFGMENDDEHGIISPGAGLTTTARELRVAIAKMIPDVFPRF